MRNPCSKAYKQFRIIFIYIMKIIHISECANQDPVLLEEDSKQDSKSENQIHLFTQFFISSNPQRNQEIKECLRKNAENPLIHTIHLLNERIYLPRELGTHSTKIKQVDIKARLKYKDVFQYIRTNEIKGYHVIANSDIFLDETLEKVRLSDIHQKRKMFALLRFEYNGVLSTIFGPRFDSQDTWIFHSRFPIQESWEKAFWFELGQPGCDNKLLYLMKILGYDIYNDPLLVRTYHYHTSKHRTYGQKDVIQEPWAVCVPARYDYRTMASLGIDSTHVSNQIKGKVTFEDNDKIHDYLLGKIDANQPFILPRISGIENNFAVFGRIAKMGVTPNIQNYVKRVLPAMKNNAGIQISNMNSFFKYSDLYLSAFDHCEIYCGWEPQGNYIHHIAESHQYILDKYAKQIVWSFALDIFHYIFVRPWTHAFRGKRILVISTFAESIREKIPIREKIYGIDLFPECEITCIKPPQTQAGEPAREFDIELADFYMRLDAVKDTYDIALVSCGGYANPVCAHIYESGKSAIYVGGVLQMYFGILGKRWLKERPDIVRLFLNEHWSRPKPEERPQNCEAVEGGCYW